MTASLLSSAVRSIFAALAVLCFLRPARATPPPAFEARFENDTAGTWLVCPTIPGWHYKIEGSPTPDADDFNYVPDSFRYGAGGDARWWIAPPPPPVVPPDPPPPSRIFRGVNVTIHVATDAGSTEVEVVRVHPGTLGPHGCPGLCHCAATRSLASFCPPFISSASAIPPRNPGSFPAR